MKIFALSLIIVTQLISPPLIQAAEPEGIITGIVTSEGKPVAFANIGITGTRFGATTGDNGRFVISKIPFGSYEIKVSYVGFETWSKKIVLTANEPEITLNISIKITLKSLDEIVVTGTRSEKRRLDSAVPVNVLNSRVLEATQSLNLSEGLSFQPGIRVEKDCQTCNYTQVRMNGLAGSYTQILINSRPLFSSLAGLYGLEQIPVSMIERVEVVKGGGSVLYGSSAVAGTINIITRDPSENNAELSVTGSLMNGESYDLQTDLYASVVNKPVNMGASLVLSQRNREPWDANSDGFSEIATLENHSLGINTFFIPVSGSRIRLGINSINEIRNGGDQLGKEPHLRLQSEYRDSKVLAANLDYTHDFYGKRTRLNFYSGVQQTKREHYTGAYGADGYGTTQNHTLISGVQVNHTILNFITGKNIFTAGAEYQYDYVMDEIEAYQYLIRQETFQPGVFLQSDWDLHPRLNFVSGLRWSKHNKMENDVISPRFNLLYKVTSGLQFRVSRSSGFRAPQAFDTDMHIAFSGGGVALTTIDPELQPESSVSYATSLDYNYPRNKYIFGFTLSGFHTRLNHTFILEEQTGTGNNTVLHRTNGGESVVKGLTFEFRGNYNYRLEGDLGMTLQESKYDFPVYWSNTTEGTTSFLRTPGLYGYFTLTWSWIKNSKISASGVYTGSMKVPHFAGAPGVDQDMVKDTETFMELNLKVEYRIPKVGKRLNLSISGGVQNLFNAFQSDFDRGPDRDSNYIYGPGRPRTLFMGLRISKNPGTARIK